MAYVDAETGEVIPVFVRSANNYDVDAVSRETGLACEDGTRTQQQFEAECNINTIVERFGLTGEMPIDPRIPLGDEFIEAMDYRSSLDAIRAADAAFMEYPAQLRARFENDPQKFAEFVLDDANKEECVKLGLRKAPASPQEPPIMKVEVVPAPTPTKSA